MDCSSWLRERSRPPGLLLSGVGPRGREAEIFPDQSPPPFAIDNPLVGAGVYDYVITMVTYSYDGTVPHRTPARR